jgi:acetyltransferase-like isoleucine patch superfamily enzyme
MSSLFSLKSQNNFLNVKKRPFWDNLPPLKSDIGRSAILSGENVSDSLEYSDPDRKATLLTLSGIYCRMKWKKAIWMILGILPALLEKMIVYWPNPLGNYIRYGWYKCRLRHLGKKSVIDFGVHIIQPSLISIGDYTHVDRHVTLAAGKITDRGRKIHLKVNPSYIHEPGEIHIGSHVHIAPYAYLVGSGGIQIGDDTGIASGSRLYSLSNHYCNPETGEDKTLYSFSNMVSPDRQLLFVGPVVMEKNSGLGLNAVMLPGSCLGENSWAGVLSCVIGSIPPNSIASGCPAAVIRERKQ